MNDLPSCNPTSSGGSKAANSSNNPYGLRRTPPSSEGGSFNDTSKSFAFFYMYPPLCPKPGSQGYAKESKAK